MSTIVYRARCARCDSERRCPDPGEHEDSLPICDGCGYRVESGWERWEVEERDTWVAELFGFNGLGAPDGWGYLDRWGNRIYGDSAPAYHWPSKRAAVEAMVPYRGGRDGWGKRARKVVLRRLRKVTR